MMHPMVLLRCLWLFVAVCGVICGSFVTFSASSPSSTEEILFSSFPSELSWEQYQEYLLSSKRSKPLVLLFSSSECGSEEELQKFISSQEAHTKSEKKIVQTEKEEEEEREEDDDTEEEIPTCFKT